MFQQYTLICVIIISNLNNFINAVTNFQHPISLTTFKPSSLLLPPGFDTQVIPRQPMLYPYAIATTALPTKPTLRKSKPITTADWIPLAGNSKPEFHPLPTFSSSTRPMPILEDAISPDLQYSSSSPSLNNGPVFESIVYGTWKPDPPLQPVAILNDNKLLKKQQQQQQHRQQQHIDRRSDDSIYNNISDLVADGKFYNKTIHRQHGGFIGLIQPKLIKTERHNLQRNDSDKSLSNLSAAEHKIRESLERNTVQKQSKVKKQGRQKIRPISQTTEQTTIERSSLADVTTTMITETTITPLITKESLQYQKNVNKFNATDTKLMEVVKRINESTEIKYNHKQNSQHSIDMMMTILAHANDQHLNHNNDGDEDDDNDDDYSIRLGVLELQTTTIPSVSFETKLQANNNEDNKDDLENVSATRRSWPIDFLNTPFTTTTDGIHEQWNNLESVDSSSMEKDASHIPSELSALNIPPSLWPKLPGNITKLGKPYETKNSAEEPALCVPITVQEQNIMNTRELVFIERVFCFPMPHSTTMEYSAEEANLENQKTTITTRSSIKAKVQNFNDFVDTNLNLRVANRATSNLKNHLFLVNFILIINFKFIV